MTKCAKCGKEHGGIKKVCDLCLEKRKAKYVIEKTNRELERESKKTVKKLLNEGLPEIYSSYSIYQDYWRSLNIQKSFEQYKAEVDEWHVSHIRAQANKQADTIHHQNKNNRRFVSQFLRPDLYPFSDKERCKEYRFQKLGLHPENETFLKDHIEEDFCATCKEWFYQLKNSTWENYMLQSEPNQEGNFLVAFIIYREQVRQEAYEALTWEETNLPIEELAVLWNAKEEEAKAKIKEYLADSVVLELPSEREGKIWKVNVFCNPDKIKPIGQTSYISGGGEQRPKPSIPQQPNPLEDAINYQRSLDEQQPQPSEPQQSTEQPKPKSNNPSYEEWSQSH